MAKLLRVALIGGPDLVRATRRAALESNQGIQVILDTDGFKLTPDQLITYDFDVAVLEFRLPDISAFDFTRALLALGKVNSIEVGRVLITSVYQDLSLRQSAIASGAVDCLSLEDGIASFVENVERCADVDADFGIREIVDLIPQGSFTEEELQKSVTLLDSLDQKEREIIKQFCSLKSDSQIAQSVQVPKSRVRSAITKAQNLFLLSTRSQLMLRLKELGDLAL